ncbi:MAG: GNAT family N-acetyltransferase [Candidatus Bathyarchaeota archaeon]|nr:GNAT family N-acetyltransferase [Candidatus Bathyarchaeota archaeon]
MLQVDNGSLISRALKTHIALPSDLTRGRRLLSITIRQACLNDLETLCKIEEECFTREPFSEEQIAFFLGSSKAVSLKAQVDGEIAGFVLGLIERSGNLLVGHIYTLDVAPRYRRIGIGVRLLEEVENSFRREDAEACVLEVRVSNLVARKLYRKQGYIEHRKLDNFYAKGIHGIQLEKKLKK